MCLRCASGSSGAFVLSFSVEFSMVLEGVVDQAFAYLSSQVTQTYHSAAQRYVWACLNVCMGFYMAIESPVLPLCLLHV